ncbi:hypothetical protein OG756_20305 [Streptomyces sp. NBC_01310]|uniref:hypothetical protein n=1 Tax=Streptomyces sp. NBC_01310 TaxID=2903820 RepID=UPI0035B580DF|nr:hypothetical protein OG756_20305 [Streptomyces sp. NBC_01310]
MHRFTRFTVPAALCVTLLAASPGLAGAANAPERKPAPAAGKAVPGVEALLAQVQSLGAVSGLLKPVTDLLAAVLKSPDGKIPEADLAALKEKIETALADVKKSLPATPELPVPVPELPVPVPELPVQPPVVLPVEPPALPAPSLPAPALPAPALPAPALPAPALPAPALPAPALPAPALPAPALPAPALPVTLPAAAPVAVPAAAKAPAPASGPAAAPRAAAPAGPLDLVTGAIDKLKESVDGLTKVAGPCGCSTDAKAKATSVVTDLVAALIALLAGLGLPGLPPLPLPVEPPALPVK